MRMVVITLLLVIMAGLACAAQGVDDASQQDNFRPNWIEHKAVTLRGLDKISGEATDFEIAAGEPARFGSLEVRLKRCFEKPPTETPESAAFLSVSSLKPMVDRPSVKPGSEIFSGWMFASSPGLNALEHPVYDIWVIGCAGEGKPRVGQGSDRRGPGDASEPPKEGEPGMPGQPDRDPQ